MTKSTTKNIQPENDFSNSSTIVEPSNQPTPVVASSDVVQLQQQISLLVEHINFIYKYLGITSNADSRFDARRTETGMGAFINSKSDFV